MAENAPSPSPESKGEDDIIARARVDQGNGQRSRANVMSAVIIIALVAVGIYFASRPADQDTATNDESAEATEEVTATENAVATETTETATETDDEAEASSEPTDETTESTGSYSETAAAGEGTTHLARRAIGTYLSRDDAPELSAEQKIYAEDYLVKRTANRYLEVGETISFNEGLIQDAVSGAQNLSATQIENLTPYAQLVSTI